MAGEKTNIFATIELPDEFIALCADNMVTPETMLRTFISDVSGIINWAKDPRKDGYSSGGSDERDMAKRYMNRCSYAFLRNKEMVMRRFCSLVEHVDASEWWTA